VNQVVRGVESSIGAFEAKAQLSRLLRAVEQGEHFTITVRGRPVADLVPHRSPSSAGVAAAIEALQAFPRIRGVSDADLTSFVAEGRR
jgi:prevent-host-death family protein